MKERTNEENLDLFADLLEPMYEIIGDEEVQKLWKSKGKAYQVAALAIRRHKREVITVLALTDGIDPAEYKVNVLTLPVKLVRLLNMPEMDELFTLRGQMSAAASSGSATENTGGGAN